MLSMKRFTSFMLLVGYTAFPTQAQLTTSQSETYKLDPAFYTKATPASDILIVSSDNVSDFAHKETAYLFNTVMDTIHPQVAKRVRARKPLCLLIGHAEQTSDLPQFKTDKTGEELDFYNWRRRGFVTELDNRPVAVFAEEDVLEYDGGMKSESILIHEFAHLIHKAGFDDAQQKKLTEAFEQSKKLGLWNDGYAAQRFRRVEGRKKVSLLDALIKWFPLESPALLRASLADGDIIVNRTPAPVDVTVNGDDKVAIVFGGPKRCYAALNRSEYWAEGLQCWYDTNRIMDHDHNQIHTRAQLKKYDRDLSKLCLEVLGDHPWRFVSPRKRAGFDHLKNFNPLTAPKKKQLPHIREAALDYYDDYWAPYWQRLYDKHKLPSPHTRPLFNGRNLIGWRVDVPALDKNPEGRQPFVVRDGKLVSLGKPNGHLVYTEKKKNYRLDVSYRFVGKPGNCGVLVHASRPRALYKMFPKSIEVQMFHKNAGDFWCIVEDISVPHMTRRRGPKEKWGITEGKARRILNLTDESEHAPGEWNQMRIECLDREIKVWVNGDLVNHGFDCTANEGKIAIQAEGAEVEFRQLDFTPINQLSP